MGKGYVVEAVNDAVRVDTTSGHKGGVMSLNKFFGLPSPINRTNPGVYGPEPTDPTCVYDSSTGTFYLVMLELALDPKTGDFTGRNSLDIAVTKKPTGTWRIYRLPVQDDGTRAPRCHPNCPCIGDYPHIGFDAYGFYITTNEYSFFPSDRRSTRRRCTRSTRGRSPRAPGDLRHAVRHHRCRARPEPASPSGPAHSPSGRDFDKRHGGTEYFLSSNAAEEARGDDSYTRTRSSSGRMTGTRTFNRAHPAARLRLDTLPVSRLPLPPGRRRRTA